MGKGDRKTAKGKRYAGSYGIVRPHKAVTSNGPVVAVKKTATKKAPAKKKAS